MSAPQQEISASERIHELWDINASVPEVLSSAGHAIEALTTRPIQSQNDNDQLMTGNNDSNHDNDTIDAHKEAFTAHAKEYFTHVQSILARLRRQAYALEEAGIIASEAPVYGSSAPTGDPQSRAGDRGRNEQDEKLINGGLGKLDVGVLNSRVNTIGADKEAQLLSDAREMLAKIVNDAAV